MTRREEIIIEMLSRYQEAQEPDGKGGQPGSGERVPLMPATWNRSYRELERCLRELRAERTCQYWHLSERYLRCRIITVDCKVVKGKIRLPEHSELVAGAAQAGEKTARVRLRQWDPGVRAEKVRRAVAWLAVSFQGDPYMPVEMTELAA